MAGQADEQTPGVGRVVGENLARIRRARRLTQHETARLLARHGLRWTRSTIAAVESGDRARVDLGEAVHLAVALDVQLADLVLGVGDVRLTDGLTVDRGLLVDYLAGGSLESVEHEVVHGAGSWMDPHASTTARLAFVDAATEADATLAAGLGMTTWDVWKAAVDLWGRSLTEERDRRVDLLGTQTEGERRARRGHITRGLAAEVTARLRPADYDGGTQG